MKCDRSVITMTLHWHSSQISSVSNCVDYTPTKTALESYKMKQSSFHQILDSETTILPMVILERLRQSATSIFSPVPTSCTYRPNLLPPGSLAESYITSKWLTLAKKMPRNQRLALGSISNSPMVGRLLHLPQAGLWVFDVMKKIK